MFTNIFKKKKYLDCALMKHSLHFFYDEIRACCCNAKGPVFYPDYKGETVDWDKTYEVRKQYIKKINSFFNKEEIPSCCKNCTEIEKSLSQNKVKPFDNTVNKLYFHTNMSCNAKCTYCTYSYYNRDSRYKIIPLLNQLITKKILSKHASVYMSGGEITISPEFEELLSILIDYLESKIEILSSGIKYCKSIENAFKKDKLQIMISIDSSNAETYKKIKQVDCFDKVINNIKTYISASENAKNNIILKYIIVDGINDKIEDIKNFVELVHNLEVKKIRLDFDYEKYKYSSDKIVPEYYFDLYDTFYKETAKYNLDVQKYDQVDAILNKSR